MNDGTRMFGSESNYSSSTVGGHVHDGARETATTPTSMISTSMTSGTGMMHMAAAAAGSSSSSRLNSRNTLHSFGGSSLPNANGFGDYTLQHSQHANRHSLQQQQQQQQQHSMIHPSSDSSKRNKSSPHAIDTGSTSSMHGHRNGPMSAVNVTTGLSMHEDTGLPIVSMSVPTGNFAEMYGAGQRMFNTGSIEAILGTSYDSNAAVAHFGSSLEGRSLGTSFASTGIPRSGAGGYGSYHNHSRTAEALDQLDLNGMRVDEDVKELPIAGRVSLTGTANANGGWWWWRWWRSVMFGGGFRGSGKPVNGLTSSISDGQDGVGHRSSQYSSHLQHPDTDLPPSSGLSGDLASPHGLFKDEDDWMVGGAKLDMQL
ncbi:hypothetical protein BC831DRAFT_486503 [Entophlyctis helioformis]|nr:hypothetical protein BC831DRAFT_486503 [Entophlyctis helioformis]